MQILTFSFEFPTTNQNIAQHKKMINVILFINKQKLHYVKSC